MKRFLILIGIINLMLSYAEAVDTIPANNNKIEYTGRIDFSNSLAPRFSYSGVSIRACFTGTSIGAIMDDDVGENYYNIILDGRIIDTLNITKEEKLYSFASELSDTIHEIELFKRTELTFGKTKFFGFVIDDGDSLVPIQNTRELLIEYIGNSITCGYGNEGKNGETFGPTTENHYLTYAAITSRNFNASHMAECRSGIGVYRNYNGPADGNTDCMTNYYTRIFLYDENPKYDFAVQPDLVCINLGTNDFSTTGGDSAKYVNNYFRLIDTIQTKYSEPDIVCLLGPMMSGNTLSNVRNYLKFIADSANNKGKGRVTFFEVSAQTGDLGLGIDYHPTVAQHKKNAMELTEYIKTLKGWKITPLVINAKTTGINQIELEFNTEIHDSINNFSGFTIYADNVQYFIDSVYSSTTDNNIINIVLQQNLSPNVNITLSYVPGTIESIDSVMVGRINMFLVQNNIKETTVSRAITNSDGTEVILSFNKNLDENSTIDGLSLTINKDVTEIDSFNISGSQLHLFNHDMIRKGDSVFVSYSGENIYGTDNVFLENFSKLEVENSSDYTSLFENTSTYFNIYPNPNHDGIFNYSFEKSYLSERTVLEVLDISGKVLYKHILVQYEGRIDLSEKISNGLYYFRISNGISFTTKSVVIE